MAILELILKAYLNGVPEDTLAPNIGMFDFKSTWICCSFFMSQQEDICILCLIRSEGNAALQS